MKLHWLAVKGYPVSYRLRPMGERTADIQQQLDNNGFRLRVWDMKKHNGKWLYNRCLFTGSFPTSDEAKASGLMQVRLEGPT